MSDSASRPPVDAPRRRSRLRRWIGAHPTAAWYWGLSVVAVALYAIAAPVQAVAYGLPLLGALLLPALQSAALVAAVRFPWPAIGVFTVAGIVTAMRIPPLWLPWPWHVTEMIGFVVLVGATWAFHGWKHGVVAYLAPALAISAPAVLESSARSLATWIVAVSIGVVAVGAGALLSDRIRMAGQLTRERAVSEAETERRLVAEERQRIARELHDVVAHGLSLIQVQATSAPYRVPDLGDRAAEEFTDIAKAARASLHEMRSLLSALRGDGEAPERAPQPTLEDIRRIVGETERAGARIQLKMPETPPVPTAVAIAAFRIVQEGISNAVRHAPGAAIEVSVGVIAEALMVEVQNDARSTDPSSRAEPGHGLVGMRERAHLLGGSFQSGPTPAGGYRVSASLPLAATEQETRR